MPSRLRNRTGIIEQRSARVDGLSRQDRADKQATAHSALEAERLRSLATPKTATITSADSPYAVSDHTLVVCDMSSGNITVTLPAASTYGIMVNRDGASNTLTVTPASGDTIGGGASLSVATDGQTAHLRLVSGDWRSV